MPGILGATAMAARLPLSPLCIGAGVASADVMGVWRLRLPDFGDGWHYLSGHANAHTGLVSGDVAGDDAEERSECFGASAGIGVEEL